MSLVNFKQGTKSSVDETPESEGTIYFTTDTQEIIVDLPEGERTSYGKLPHSEITNEEIDEIFDKYDFQFSDVPTSGTTPGNGSNSTVSWNDIQDKPDLSQYVTQNTLDATTNELEAALELIRNQLTREELIDIIGTFSGIDRYGNPGTAGLVPPPNII